MLARKMDLSADPMSGAPPGKSQLEELLPMTV